MNSPNQNPSLTGAFDLTLRPPRSPRVRLGGYVILPRMLDKGRALLANRIGDYHFNCPIDQMFLSFAGVDAEKLKVELARGRGDGKMLAWIAEHAVHRRSPWEIEQWSDFMGRQGPDLHTDLHAFFVETAAGLSRARGELRSWFDLLDLDDHVSFGGVA